MSDDATDRGPDFARRFHRLIRRAVLSYLTRYGFMARFHLPALVRQLERLIPAMAGTFKDAQVSGWLDAARSTAEAVRLPKLADPFRPAPALAPENAPGGVRFPAIEAAAKWVDTRIPFAPEDYAQLDADARRVAFTVAGAVSEEAVDAVRRAVGESVRDGGTFREFRRDVAAALEHSAVSEPQLEAVYRTTVGKAYSAGQLAALDHPLVASEFPYFLYSATHDSRVRPEHLEMERLGLDGTAVYRSDDPLWDVFFPPWAWNCRCVVIPLSIEDAASYGAAEARQWLETGVPPADPQYVPWPPFRPPPGWVPTGRRLVA